jgi:RNA polymerase sigma-70 factor (ECF subfamily)
MDKDLILRCAKQDRLAQKAVFEKLFGKMYPVCKRYMKNDDDAMDVLNNGFLKVFTNIKQFSFQGSFEGWVKRIVINTAIDHIKTNSNYKMQTVFEIEDNPGSVDNEAMATMELDEVYGMIRMLPPASQSVFNMYAIDGMSHKEIAAEMGISEGTSKWHVSFARQELKRMMKKKETKLSLAS